MTQTAAPHLLRFRRLSHFFWGLFIATTVGCGGHQGAPNHFGEGLPKAPSTPATQNLERAMFERVNRDRARNQLPPLKYDNKLGDIARSHATDMRDNHFFEHESPRFGQLEARLHRAGYLFITGRENLAEAQTVDEAEDGLLKSPHHYENLMAKDITHVGIGLVKGGVQDPRNFTFTQIFATPGKRETDTEAAIAVGQTIAAARHAAKAGPLTRHPHLDKMAREELASLKGDPNTSLLKEVGVRVAARMAQSPIPGTTRVSVGAQVVVDSSQFTAEGAVLSPNAKYYGLSVDRGSKGGSAQGVPRLRVLVLIGMR